MSKVAFFKEATLRSWVEILQRSQTVIKLPMIDESWYADVMSCVEITQINPEAKADFRLAAASIFYKITKNHYRVDGNKRSAVVGTYLFFIVNDADLDCRPDDLYLFAKKVACSKKDSEECLQMIREFFEDNAKEKPV